MSLHNNNNNSSIIIKSCGVAEISFDEWENTCYQADHFSFNKLKEIPFFKLLCNVDALHLKYEMLQPTLTSRLLRDLYMANVDLMKSFEKITELCDDLYANSYIKDIEDSIRQFENYIDDIPFDFFDYDETKGIMDRILVEINNFSKKLEDVLNYLRIIVDGDYFFIEILKKDFFSQLKNR